MSQTPVIGLLGAEKQAAVSAALAWPERQFLFATDQEVADGWDLANVSFLHGTPDRLPSLPANVVTTWVPLCARWLTASLAEPTNNLGTFELSTVVGRLHNHFGVPVLPTTAVPPQGKSAIVKGNAWHRPDATLISATLDSQEILDPYGCGLVFQEHWPWERLFLATGRRWANGAVTLAVFRIYSEVCARDDVIGAGEVVAHPVVTELTLAMLDALDHRGFFTLNWLARGAAVRLTSLRPVPRATFGAWRRAGGDPFAPSATGIFVAPAGAKFVVDIHYSSYQRLAS